MKYGIVTSAGSIQDYVIMAREAEKHGWDGVFTWDGIVVSPVPVFDSWVALGAMAAATERVTLGAMVFSLGRRRPWKVARETISVDHLSNGRLVIPVGTGGTWDGGYSRVNTDQPDRKSRRGKLHECLEILDLAWTGEEFSYDGEYYQCTDLQFLPKPVQQPRIPIWVVGGWPREDSMDRAARWDGIVAADLTPGVDPFKPTSIETVKSIHDWMQSHRESMEHFDIVVEGVTDPADQAAIDDRIGSLQEAGATWFIESRWNDAETGETLLERIRQGPPRV